MGRKGRRRGLRKVERAEERKAKATRTVMDEVRKRLDVLEYLILFFALVLALAGGALVAWMTSSFLDYSFRWSWALASILLFIIPGGTVYLRELRRTAGRGDEVRNSLSQQLREQDSTPKDFHG